MRLRLALVVSLAAALFALTMIDSRSTLAALAFGFGVWLIVGSLASLTDRVRSGTLRTIPRSTLGMVIATRRWASSCWARSRPRRGTPS